MSGPRQIALVVLISAVTGALGYWWGSSRDASEAASVTASAPSPSATSAAAPQTRRILYYKHPMGLPDTSPVPKKDAMGMDYVPVYEGDEPQGPQVKISLDKVQKLGVRTEVAQLRPLTRTVRATGTLEINERRLSTVSPKFEGWIQKLIVNATGQRVTRGEPLLEVYSPDLITAQEEYVVAWRGLQALQNADLELRARMQSLMDSSLQRLRNWDIAPAELSRLQSGGEPRNALVLRSPVTGVVLEKPAVEGMRFMPGEMLYKIADLSTVWLLVDIFEQDLALVHRGQAARILVDAYPGEEFQGQVVFLYPTVTPETRTARARIELPNRQGRLKPAMYARVELDASHGPEPKLAIPDSAVLDSGTRQVVLVERGEGIFEPREVALGFRADGYVEVLRGVQPGEKLVVSANFLIDAESNLKAALGSFGHGHGSGAGEAASSEANAPGGESPVPGTNMPKSTDPAAEHSGH